MSADTAAVADPGHPQGPIPDSPSPLDLRILTPGLTEEEIAAVTSVISAMLEEQRESAAREATPPGARWRRSVERTGVGARGATSWRWSAW